MQQRLQNRARVISHSSDVVLGYRGNITTAYTDPKANTIGITSKPRGDDDVQAMKSLYGLTIHEAGHVRFTGNVEAYLRKTAKALGANVVQLHQIFNMLEDGRLENFIMQLYPGTVPILKHTNDLYMEKPDEAEHHNPLAYALYYAKHGVRAKGWDREEELMESIFKHVREARTARTAKDVVNIAGRVYQELRDAAADTGKPEDYDHAEGGNWGDSQEKAPHDIQDNIGDKDEAEEEAKAEAEAKAKEAEEAEDGNEAVDGSGESGAGAGESEDEGDESEEGEAGAGTSGDGKGDEESDDSGTPGDGGEGDESEEGEAGNGGMSKEEAESAEMAEIMDSIARGKQEREELEEQYPGPPSTGGDPGMPPYYTDVKTNILAPGSKAKFDEDMDKPTARRLEREMKELIFEKRKMGVSSRRGRLHDNRLWRHGAYKDDKVFRRKDTRQDPRELHTLILVDESGSMGGDVNEEKTWSYADKKEDMKSTLARKAVITLHEALRKARLKHCIVGFTADHGASVRHYIHKRWDDAGPSYSLSEITHRSNNRDGVSLRLASEYFPTDAKNRLVIMLSDGYPAAGGYEDETGLRDTIAAVEEVKKKGITVVGIGIAFNPKARMKEAYDAYISLEQPGDLVKTLAKIVKKEMQ